MVFLGFHNILYDERGHVISVALHHGGALFVLCLKAMRFREVDLSLFPYRIADVRASLKVLSLIDALEPEVNTSQTLAWAASNQKIVAPSVYCCVIPFSQYPRTSSQVDPP